MSAYRPYPGLHVTLMTRKTAEAHDRFVYRVEPETGIGWQPYTVRVHSHGCTAYMAFHNVKALRTWLGAPYTVRVCRKGAGVAFGTIVAA